MISDTIAAIATPLGEGGIAVIRISGSESVQIAERIFRSKSNLSEVPSHTIHYGFIEDPVTGERIDEVLVSVMRAPRSFTMEDVVEINCHGGILPVKNVLRVVLQSGARLAEPGEFTKRAFLNGRIDLTQAEAVIDLIRSKSDRTHHIAMKQAQGALSKKVKQLRHQLVELMAHIEVNIDYPEHDVEEMTNAYIKEQCNAIIDQLDQLLATADEGKILREGIVTAIIGKPNVGKSSLLNLLVRDNKAIVTDIPGTTRDVIEEYVNLNGIPLKLLDTAGIRDTSDIVEQIGVERSRAALSEADLILLVLNYNEPLSNDEFQLMDQIKERNVIVIINKIDLPGQFQIDDVKQQMPQATIIQMSVKEEHGLEYLEKAISEMFLSGRIESEDLTYVSNVRHIDLLQKAKDAIEEAYDAAEQWTPIDMIQIDLRHAWEQLGLIIGDSVAESLIDQIFSQFCLGK